MRAKRYADILGDLHRSRRRAKYWTNVEQRSRRRRERDISNRMRRLGMRWFDQTDEVDTAGQQEVMSTGYIGCIWGATMFVSIMMRMKNPQWPTRGPKYLPNKKFLSVKVADSSNAGQAQAKLDAFRAEDRAVANG